MTPNKIYFNMDNSKMYNVNVKNNSRFLIYQQFNKIANVIVQIIPLIVLSSIML
jgi:hypothetical protein